MSTCNSSTSLNSQSSICISRSNVSRLKLDLLLSNVEMLVAWMSNCSARSLIESMPLASMISKIRYFLTRNFINFPFNISSLTRLYYRSSKPKRQAKPLKSVIGIQVSFSMNEKWKGALVQLQDNLIYYKSTVYALMLVEKMHKIYRICPQYDQGTTHSLRNKVLKTACVIFYLLLQLPSTWRGTL